MKMSRRAKRMERHHKRNKIHAVINIVSMIDMLTVLVLFLLVNAGNVQNIPSAKTLKLPESTATKAPKETVVLMVNNQDIVVQGRKVASVAEVVTQDSDVIPSLLEELNYQMQHGRKLKADGGDAPGEITIMGDRQIPYLLLKKIMVTCTKADYTNISLSVVSTSAKG